MLWRAVRQVNVRSTALRVLRLGFLQDGDVGFERQYESRKLQIKRVNFLAADVAQHQRRIIRGQTAPRSNFTNRQARILSD